MTDIMAKKKAPPYQPKLKRRFIGSGVSNTPSSRSNDPDAPLNDQAWLMVKIYTGMESPCIFTAYKQAGYEGRGLSGASAAQEIFYAPNFQKALKEELELRDKFFRVDAAIVIRNLERMANASLKDYGDWTSEGFVLKSSDELTRDQAYAIAEIKQKANGEMSIKLESRMRANELLATHFGLLIPDAGKIKDAKEHAEQIKEAFDELNGSVPIAPPPDQEAVEQEEA